MTHEFTIPIQVSTGPDEEVPVRFLNDQGTTWWMDQLEKRPGITVVTIGRSRDGRPLYGLRIGDGPLRCSITAGAHADEPAGPIAACLIAWYLSSNSGWARTDRETYSYYICPQVNPDGSEANKEWFAPVPDVGTYLRHVKRELPGDDIEFGYPGNGRNAIRPENAAVAGFLRPGGPYHFHASLHSMAMAEGAWFLIEKSWADRSTKLQQALASRANAFGFKLHDIQRNGDKGFSRISRGFCTTPTSVAMKEHFLQKGDQAMASKFHLSSMEFIGSLGNDPLALVTEIPAFAINGGWQNEEVKWSDLDTSAPEPGSTAYERCRAEIGEKIASGDIDGAVAVGTRYGATPVPFAVHSGLQYSAVLRAVRELRNYHTARQQNPAP